MKKVRYLIVILFFYSALFSQSFIFFNDSPNNNFYDPSWGFFEGPSFLELAGVNNNKFPVSSENSFNGSNSLKLSWRSESGGNWGLAIAEDGWPPHDIRTKDSLIFYINSKDNIDLAELPKIYLEDINNNKSDRHSLSDFISSLSINNWEKVSIPLSVFVDHPGSANVGEIKTIFFGQNNADAVNHTIFIDNVKMISVGDSNDNIAPNTPANVIATGYDSHIDIEWNYNTDDDIDSYRIYRLEDSVYVLLGTAGKHDRFFTDFIGAKGVSHSYKVAAQDDNLNISELSNEVLATTYEMSDEELLTMVQRATFRYFWDYANPVSGLSRERYRIDAGNTVTSGGSGFGIMAILVGIERNFISREEGAVRILKISKFLRDEADRFHGAWSHWLNGETGEAKPFSANDDGGDIVETSFLIQGLLTAREYFKLPNPTEIELVNVITELWETVEWNFYRKFDHSPYLYWHWSPNFGWIKDFRIRGYMETLITYVLAVASPTHGIPGWCYEDGWVESRSNYTSNDTFYGYRLYVGRNMGGPLFFAHYSYLGLDPRNIRDNYANYFLHNKNQTLINRAYCIDNPKGYVGYGENTWGLTASDNPWGYSAHAPNTNDNGTITPTAAISSIPYTPQESIAALKNFYRNYGDRLWGIYGFKDAFNLTENWFANSYIAIDQGPIICMIENYRSQLLWNNFMKNAEIKTALDSIGFIEDLTDINNKNNVVYNFDLSQNYPNPFNPITKISYTVPTFVNKGSVVKLTVFDPLGREIKTLVNGPKVPGYYTVDFDASKLPSGVYYYSIKIDNYLQTKKMVHLK